MTFASKSLLLAAVLAVVLSGVLWHRLDSTRHDNQTLRRELQTAQQARHTAASLSCNNCRGCHHDRYSRGAQDVAHRRHGAKPPDAAAHVCQDERMHSSLYP